MSYGGLRPELACPSCGKRVLMVYHEWKRRDGVALFEYHHEDDPRRDVPAPCIVTYPYEQGLAQMDAETDWSGGATVPA